MKRTVIISAFPACGKTYLYENQDTLQFSYLGERRQFTFCDSDSSKYEKKDGWVQKYVDDLEQKIGVVDFLFISQHEEVLQELRARNIPFVVVAPDNSVYLTDKERQLIKQQWFGRFVLRDNNHIKDFNAWLELMKEHYDEWTDDKHLLKYGPVSFFLLKENQYLSDLIKDLYWMKENNDNYVVHMVEDITDRVSKFYKDIQLNMPIVTAVSLLPSNAEQLSDEELKYALTRLAEYSRRP